MKAYRTNSYFTIFLLLCSLIMLSGCDKKTTDNEPLLKSVISIQSAENISTTSALLVARVTPNQDGTTINFMYRATTDALWTSKVFTEKLTGTKAFRVDVALIDLVPNTQYTFYAKSTNSAGEVISSMMTFTTAKLTGAVIKIKAAQNVKISTASLSASIIPNQENTIVSFEYQTINSAWKSQTLSAGFNGTDSIKVNLDLYDLQANTLYNFRIKATNVAGETLSETASFTTYAVNDYDGNYYHSVTIGSQTWLKENFRGTHYSNGDPIANVTDPNSWASLNTGAYCWYNNDPEIGKVYGGLYNWYTGADSRGLIVGWHTPTGYEQADLMNNFKDYITAGLSVMETGNTHWLNTKYSATNSTGFSALPNGAFSFDQTSQKFVFIALHNSASFWSLTDGGSSADATIIQNYNCGFGVGAVCDKKNGMGIRLLKN
ncbi:MAG: fibrobacter succinogenes major paralogous domain-containing protein [Bacteroidales bacterium]